MAYGLKASSCNPLSLRVQNRQEIIYMSLLSKIYRVGAVTVGLSLSNHTFQITIFMSMLNWGQFREKKLYFENNLLFIARIQKDLSRMNVTHITAIIFRTQYFICTELIFSWIQIFLPHFAGTFFLPLNHLAFLKDRYRKKLLLKKSKAPSLFFFFWFCFFQTYRLKLFFCFRWKKKSYF